MMNCTLKIKIAAASSALGLGALGALGAGVAAAGPAGAAGHAPVSTLRSVASASQAPSAQRLFAYYYIWYNTRSWRRAKTDYPSIGRYDSGDPVVVRTQIRQAKWAGINGFIVSWKNNAINNRRLQLLISIAGQEHFKLAMIYQGLNFHRQPLPVGQVAKGFRTFMDKYAGNRVFVRLHGKPLTIWSGTWAYSHAAVKAVTGPVRRKMLVLSTQKSVQGFRQLADVTDGDAYYWSSVNPATNKGYAKKLNAMSAAVHQAGKYFIAPFAPGFDARLLGGKAIVPRNNGRTLRTEYAAAVRSSPDILGLISWNEFSENTYVEPSLKYRAYYLRIIRQLRQTALSASRSAAHSSSAGPGPAAGGWTNTLRLGGSAIGLVLVAGVLALARRRFAGRVAASARMLAPAAYRHHARHGESC